MTSPLGKLLYFAMVCRRISEGMKQRSLELLQEGWELPHIAEALDVSPQSMSRWVDNYQQHGHVQQGWANCLPPIWTSTCRRVCVANDAT
ncbi:hypothetical protein AcV5_009829 [Taiwanofungus camphoratus]|nr:hypothetical protein AcV5_002466 [Antrodia cinnamomea]KAI0922979.1 hypothetical protein AcV5_009829 [Antrodia cinnamomea]